jgi:calmodulin
MQQQQRTNPLPTSTNEIFGPFSLTQLNDAFQTFDLDRNGYVSAYELRHLYTQLGEDVTDEEIEEMLRMCDIDGDGQVNPNEFQRMIFRYASRIEDNVNPKLVSAVTSPTSVGTSLPVALPVKVPSINETATYGDRNNTKIHHMNQEEVKEYTSDDDDDDDDANSEDDSDEDEDANVKSESESGEDKSDSEDAVDISSKQKAMN